MDLQSSLTALDALQRKMAAYDHALGLLYYDGATTAPSGTAANRGESMAILSEASYQISTCKETEDLLESLWDKKDKLTEAQRRMVFLLRKSLVELRKIPVDEYVAYQRLINESEDVWHRAKSSNDYASFAPYIDRIVEANKRFAGYIRPDMDPYEHCLDSYEEGLTRGVCDEFFGALRERLVPLIQKVCASENRPDTGLLKFHAPVEKQRELSDYLMDVLGMDRAHCAIAETEHPFTTGFTKYDCRITTHYYEDNLASSLYSVVHEGGHGLYELGTGDELQFTGLDSGVSMAIHESQSRFYENIIGRSRSFCSLILPYLKKSFPESLSDVSEEAFYRMINRAEPSLIRTEADELTYSLHIMVRYELERAMLDGELTAHDLPDAWNKLYRRYLGVEVPDDRRGILQDSHWSGGNIGYFPSYALGSAYGAQILSVMQKDFDVYGSIAKHGNLSEINEWNRTHIWTHGCMYDPTDLFRRVAGEFSPDFYTDYLTKKYEEIYNL